MASPERIIVSGSSGQIGSYVVEAALQEGHSVSGIDLRPSPFTKLVGDVRHPSDIRAAAEGATCAIHLAAQISVQQSIREPGIDADHNILGTIAMLEEARRRDFSRFIFVSSAAVYGQPEKVPVNENDAKRPLSPYGMSKLAGEGYAQLYRSLYGMETVIVRPFNVFSGRQDASNGYSGVISKFAQQISQDQSPIVFGSGAQTRDFVHASDVARWMVKLATVPGPVPAQVNLGTGRETSIRELATKMLTLAGRSGEATAFAKLPSGEIERSVADVTLASEFGLKPQVPIDVGLAEVLTTEFQRHRPLSPDRYTQ